MLPRNSCVIPQCRDLDQHYRRAIAANPRNAFILREFPAYIASYEKYVSLTP